MFRRSKRLRSRQRQQSLWAKGRSGGRQCCSSTKGVACAASRRWPLATASYDQTAERLGGQRGKPIARVEVARRLAEAIWHMLTPNRPFAPAGPPEFWPPDGPSVELGRASEASTT